MRHLHHFAAPRDAGSGPPSVRARAALRPRPDESGPVARRRDGEGDPEGERGVLVTAHSRESFGAPFEAICDALRQIAERNPDVMIVYPVHLNPNVQRPVLERLAGRPRIHLLEPLDYPSFVRMMDRAHLI